MLITSQSNYFRALKCLWPTLLAALVLTSGCQSDPSVTADSQANSPVKSQKKAIVVTYDDGEYCETDDWCNSGHCVEGLCCETTCEGLCMRCSEALTGVDSGKCRPVADNTAPTASKTGECTVDPANACGETGYCAGSLAPNSTTESFCALATSTVTCNEAHCYSNDLYTGQNCNGFGSCGPHSLQEQCGLYACQGGPPPNCPTTCTGDEHCDTDASAWCYLNLDTNDNYQNCVTGKQDGETCGGNWECGSGQCNDGVCCSSACGDTCASCNTNYTGATNGVCNMVSDGLNWSDCPTDIVNQPCGLNGQCNGAGACRYVAQNTVCQGAQCQNGDVFAASLCDGAGTCNAGGLQEDCGVYDCRNADCLDTCTGDGDCATGFRCYLGGGTGVCTDKNLDGEVCNSSPQCASSHCVDQVCCQNACEGDCRGCRQ
ncbi:MAG TPA: hypothetical protein EYN66_24510, partial [Myxococcales bacterium]|nr:hypothetical protein [Myxococcales bacterium]